MRKLLWILSLTAIAVFPPTARADGIPFAGVKDGGSGTASADGLLHYVTLPMPKQTVVTKVSAEGSVLTFRTLPGAWGIPLVAFDGSTAGLSAYGRILVLAQPPIGRMRHVSRFPVLETTNLRLVDLVTLEGSFSFDAISPDGSTLYLIEHVNRKDVAEYQVRAYDIEQDRLLPYVIRDHRSNQVEMYGYPMSRATSSDGRWAYTLYQGSHHSFVHALDTVARKAVCIDLPMDTPSEYVAEAHLVLGPGGQNLAVDSARGGSSPSSTRRSSRFARGSPTARRRRPPKNGSHGCLPPAPSRWRFSEPAFAPGGYDRRRPPYWPQRRFPSTSRYSRVWAISPFAR